VVNTGTIQYTFTNTISIHFVCIRFVKYTHREYCEYTFIVSMK
jgi:hypothetical protein